MKRMLFGIAVGLVLMCGAEVRVSLANLDTPDDGGCTGNWAVSQGEDRKTTPGSGGKKLEAGDVVGGDRSSGLVALGPVRGPEKVLRAVRAMFGRLW